MFAPANSSFLVHPHYLIFFLLFYNLIYVLPRFPKAQNRVLWMTTGEAVPIFYFERMLLRSRGR